MWWMAAALANPGQIADDGTGVHEVVWARRFTFNEAQAYAHTATPRSVDHGWLLELKVTPVFMTPRQIGVPVLWVGDDLAVRTNWDHVGGCAVVWVPGDHDLERERLYFGSATLPERMDSERRALDHHAADKAGIGPLRTEQLGDTDGSALVFHDLQALMTTAKERAKACATEK